MVSQNYPSVKTDMHGQKRITPLDAGADEISSDTIAAWALQSQDVGVNVAGMSIK